MGVFVVIVAVTKVIKKKQFQQIKHQVLTTLEKNSFCLKKNNLLTIIPILSPLFPCQYWSCFLFSQLLSQELSSLFQFF